MTQVARELSLSGYFIEHALQLSIIIFASFAALILSARVKRETLACQKISVGCVCPAHSPFWISPIEQQKKQSSKSSAGVFALTP
jgi:hypothetical protein